MKVLTFIVEEMPKPIDMIVSAKGLVFETTALTPNSLSRKRARGVNGYSFRL